MRVERAGGGDVESDRRREHEIVSTQDRDDRVPNRPAAQRLDSPRSQNNRDSQRVASIYINIRLAQHVAHAPMQLEIERDHKSAKWRSVLI